MTGDPLAALIEGRYPDPDGGPPLAVPTRTVAIEDTLAGREAELVAALDLGRRLALVVDANTDRVLGARLADALRPVAEIEILRLPGRPHADAKTAARVKAASAGCDALIAVGSGTINDLCKYVAAETARPYAVFATAPSMNGYTSVNAAITVDGHKKSLPAAAASGVFFDLEVLAAAPPRMIRSGLGDSLCRPTAQADWLLAHLLFDQPYRRAPFVLLADDEPALFARAEALMAGDLTAMRRLARTLVLSGFGMTLCGSSHPASEGEHLISHYVEMMAPGDWPGSFHGEQIAVTTLTMARIQERLLANDGPPVLRASRIDESALKAHFGAVLGAACWREFAAKRLDAAAVEALNARLSERWDAIRGEIARTTIPAVRLASVLEASGAPTTPEALGWPRDFYLDAVVHARELRNRYTFLDLAADCGMLDTSLSG